MAERRRRFLDEDFLEARLALERMMDELRPLMRYQTSSLPQRLHTRLSTCFARLHRLHRELGRYPEALRAERDLEDAPPPRRTEDVQEAEPADTPSARESGRPGPPLWPRAMRSGARARAT